MDSRAVNLLDQLLKIEQHQDEIISTIDNLAGDLLDIYGYEGACTLKHFFYLAGLARTIKELAGSVIRDLEEVRYNEPTKNTG